MHEKNKELEIFEENLEKAARVFLLKKSKTGKTTHPEKQKASVTVLYKKSSGIAA